MPVILSTSAAACQRSQLRAKLRAEGFDYLADPRCNEILDDAALQVSAEHQWAERLVVASSVAEATINDAVGFERVLSVTHSPTGAPLIERQRRDLVNEGRDLGQVGDPIYWYYASSGQIETWPRRYSSTITAEYVTNSAWVAGGAAAGGDTDTPIVPKLGCRLIVLKAAQIAHLENGRGDLAESIEVSYQRILELAVARNSRRVQQRRVGVVS